jgi:hypothetical protein
MSRSPTSRTCWGIDLGGTKTEGIILSDGDYNQPLLRTRIQTESEKGYEYILTRIVSLVENMKRLRALNPKASVLEHPVSLIRSCRS